MFTLNCNGRLLVVQQPLVMGIINVTPDSFYAGSRQQGTEAILRQAEKMLNEGATILDIGGQSTRPGSERISAEEELQRVIAPIIALQKKFPQAFISVDTFYAAVAREAVQAGATIINDISSGTLDVNMITTVASLKVPYVLMHMKGTPQTMQQQAQYENVTAEVLDFLSRKKAALHKTGIADVIVDPGFGFGKTTAHNFELLRNLSLFSILKAPLLLGISRKSFIWKTLGVSPDEALNGTMALNAIGLISGASIIRVHDVKEAVQTIRLTEAYRNS